MQLDYLSGVVTNACEITHVGDFHKRLVTTFECDLQPSIIVGCVYNREIQIDNGLMYSRRIDFGLVSVPSAIHPTAQRPHGRLLDLVVLGKLKIGTLFAK